MGQAAAVLEGLKQEQPQGLGCACHITTSLHVEAEFSYLPFLHQQAV